MANCCADWRPQVHGSWRTLVVMYLVHKRVTADLGALATLAFKSYRHFWTLLLVNHSDNIVSKNRTSKKNVKLYTFFRLIYVLGICLRAVINILGHYIRDLFLSWFLFISPIKAKKSNWLNHLMSPAVTPVYIFFVVNRQDVSFESRYINFQ